MTTDESEFDLDIFGVSLPVEEPNHIPIYTTLTSSWGNGKIENKIQIRFWSRGNHVINSEILN